MLQILLYFRVVFGDKFKTSANFLNVFTNKYLDITTISNEYITNLKISLSNIFSPFLTPINKILE